MTWSKRLSPFLLGVLLLTGCGGGLTVRAGCEDWNRYIGEVNAYGPTLNKKLELPNNADNLTPEQIQGVVDAISNDIENFRQSDPPEKAVALNNQLITVLQGWIAIFTAFGDGSYDDQMVFDLQKQDDELERVTREANAACVD